MGFRSEEFIKESDSEREEDSEVGEDEIIEIQGAEAVQLNPTDAEIVELDSDDDDEDDVVIQFNTTVKDDTEANKTANDTAETEKLDDTIEVVDNSTTENTSAISLDTSDQQNVTNEEEGDDENDDNSEDSDVDGDEFDAQDDEEESSDGESDGEEDQPDTEEDQEDPLQRGNENWADAMSKVLKLGTKSKQPIGILSKAKKDNLVKKAKKEKSKGDEDSSSSSDEEGLPVSVTEGLLRAKKFMLESRNRVKPSILKKPKERGLVKVATKGVVQLFNAVREQQKNVKIQIEQAGSASKRDKVYQNIDKSDFMAVLEGKRPAYNPIVYGKNAMVKKTKLEETKEETKDEIESEDEKDDSSTWSALRQNFMVDSKLKDWDKEDVEV